MREVFDLSRQNRDLHDLFGKGVIRERRDGPSCRREQFQLDEIEGVPRPSRDACAQKRDDVGTKVSLPASPGAMTNVDDRR